MELLQSHRAVRGFGNNIIDMNARFFRIAPHWPQLRAWIMNSLWRREPPDNSNRIDVELADVA